MFDGEEKMRMSEERRWSLKRRRGGLAYDPPANCFGGDNRRAFRWRNRREQAVNLGRFHYSGE